MPLQRDVIKAVKEMYSGDMNLVRAFVKDYFQTPTGRREREDSPGAKASIGELVDRIMKDFADWDK